MEYEVYTFVRGCYKLKTIPLSTWAQLSPLVSHLLNFVEFNLNATFLDVYKRDEETEKGVLKMWREKQVRLAEVLQSCVPLHKGEASQKPALFIFFIIIVFILLR